MCCPCEIFMIKSGLNKDVTAKIWNFSNAVNKRKKIVWNEHNASVEFTIWYFPAQSHKSIIFFVSHDWAKSLQGHIPLLLRFE